MFVAWHPFSTAAMRMNTLYRTTKIVFAVVSVTDLPNEYLRRQDPIALSMDHSQIFPVPNDPSPRPDDVVKSALQSRLDLPGAADAAKRGLGEAVDTATKALDTAVNVAKKTIDDTKDAVEKLYNEVKKVAELEDKVWAAIHDHTSALPTLVAFGLLAQRLLKLSRNHGRSQDVEMIDYSEPSGKAFSKPPRSCVYYVSYGIVRSWQK
ncbi:hypothetical protein TruAng_007571 [Truncatella angustata]|nr:hypothetical protein TruAng_007571 [Truncatella angustata]